MSYEGNGDLRYGVSTTQLSYLAHLTAPIDSRLTVATLAIIDLTTVANASRGTKRNKCSLQETRFCRLVESLRPTEDHRLAQFRFGRKDSVYTEYIDRPSYRGFPLVNPNADL